MKAIYFIALFLGCLIHSVTAEPAKHCSQQSFALQILGSGGPELNDQRASSSYLIWMNGEARLMIDAGSGSSYQFERSEAVFNDIDAILITHMHPDHISELESYIKGSYFLQRDRDLNVLGPKGNALTPSIEEFTKALFSAPHFPYRYLREYFDTGSNSNYKVHIITVPKLQNTTWKRIFNGGDYYAESVYVDHGPLPAVAWKITYQNKSITFTGDTAARNAALPRLLKDSDVIVAHHAIPEDSNPLARNLHMPPSVIGELAKISGADSLILPHRMLRTIGREKESLAQIRKSYIGVIHFAEDLSCYPL